MKPAIAIGQSTKSKFIITPNMNLLIGYFFQLLFLINNTITPPFHLSFFRFNDNNILYSATFCNRKQTILMTDSQYTHTDTKKIKTANVANWLENIEPKEKADNPGKKRFIESSQ